MQSLGRQFARKREEIKKKGAEVQEVNKEVSSALLEAFTEDERAFITEHFLKDGILFFKTKNKTFANELFLRRTDLCKKINETSKIAVKEIRVY